MEFKNQYLTYEEYKALGGTLAIMPFNLLEFKAREKINELTFNRLVNLEKQVQEVKICVYELMKKYSEVENSNIKSESVGSYSVSYADLEENVKEEKNLIKTFLLNCKLEDGTPYLYRGL